MRVLVLVAMVIALLGCGSKSTSIRQADTGLVGFRPLNRSDPVGTEIYERGLQYAGTDKKPILFGTLEKGPHKNELNREIILYKSHATGTVKDWDAVAIYDTGTGFVRE